jgi:hypothetical protein
MPGRRRYQQNSNMLIINSLQCLHCAAAEGEACIRLQLDSSSYDIAALVLPASGNYESNVVGLLLRTELLDVINNRSDHSGRGLLMMSSQ